MLTNFEMGTKYKIILQPTYNCLHVVSNKLKKLPNLFHSAHTFYYASLNVYTTTALLRQKSDYKNWIN